MGKFAYEARTDDGQLTSGVVAAATLEEAGEKLSAQNLYIVKLGSAETEAASETRSSASVSRLRAGRRHIMWFMNQLAIMIETGITISESLDILSRQTADPVMAQIITDVSHSVQEGRPLSDALDAHPRTFPSVCTAMIRASEASGTLSTVLNRLAEYMLKDQQAMGKLRGALMYPAFMFLMCIGVTVFLLTVILPRFAAIYANKGAVLPAPTRILMAMSDAVLGYGLYILAAIAVTTAAAIWYLRTPGGKMLLSWLQIRSPILGDVFAKLFQSRSFRTIGTLLDSGVAIEQVLDLARSMSSNLLYRQLWARAYEDISNGERIARALAESGLFSESILHMIDCGDRSGRMGTVFIKLADFLEQEYERSVKVASQFIEPLMILFMGGIVGFVAISMLLPMFKMASVVAR